MITKDDFNIEPFPDGEPGLCCGGKNWSMETDLVFAAGAFVEGDPDLVRQREILEFIMKAIEAYDKPCGHCGTYFPPGWGEKVDGVAVNVARRKFEED